MNEQFGHDIEDLQVGMSASFAKTITEADIVLFAGVSGDNNAVHTNEEFAATTPFGGRIAHGFLTASVISAAVANRLPGPGTVYLGQQMRFLAPVRPGDTLKSVVEVLDVRPSQSKPDRGIARLLYKAENQRGETVLSFIGNNMLKRRPAAAA